jgi:hypothetical protein
MKEEHRRYLKVALFLGMLVTFLGPLPSAFASSVTTSVDHTSVLYFRGGDEANNVRFLLRYVYNPERRNYWQVDDFSGIAHFLGDCYPTSDIEIAYCYIDPPKIDVDSGGGNDYVVLSSETSGTELTTTAVVTGAGDDRVVPGPSNDTIDLGDGNDVVAQLEYSGPGGNDRIAGGGGNDDLESGSGNDAIDAGSGSDVVSGMEGNDAIYAQDGERDTIYCSAPGNYLATDRADVVYADAVDVVASDCETVHRTATSSPSRPQTSPPAPLYLSSGETKRYARKGLRETFGHIRITRLRCSRRSPVRFVCQARWRRHGHRYSARVNVWAYRTNGEDYWDYSIRHKRRLR